MARRWSIVILAACSVFVACFGSLSVRDQTLGFRDAANYYNPLFRWQCSQWSQGRIPLWNPQAGTGWPTLADATTSIFYPGKLVFALPLSFRLRYLIYVTAHVLLAVAAAAWAARRWGCSVEAAGLCGISYGFAGSVLFQCYNVVFLVGAAWMPVALVAAERMMAARSRAAAVWLGLVLALMTLGGDPQSAYHAGLLAALCGCFCRPDPSWIARSLGQRMGSKLLLLAIACATGFFLSAVQVLPSLEGTRFSERAAFDRPRSLYEVALVGGQEWFHSVSGRPRSRSPELLSGMLTAPPPGTHQAHAYDFSVAPWQLAELFWPNCSGSFFPVNRRWTSALPTYGRIWTPSLYLGLLPLLLALLSLRFRGNRARLRWLSCIAVLFLLGSFGWYGVGWLIHLVRAGLMGVEAPDLRLGAPVGGVYWLMNCVLPGYICFRYPAKLLVVVSLAISMLAAQGWDAVEAADARPLRKLLTIVGLVSLLTLGLFLLLQTSWSRWLASAPIDPLFGPLVVSGAARQLAGALVHTTIAAVVLGGILSLRLRGPARNTLLLLATAVDLIWANSGLIVGVPDRLLRAPAAIGARLGDEERWRWRLHRPRLAPPIEWSQTSDPRRLQAVVDWEHCSLHPQYHLTAGVTLIPTSAGLASSDMRAVSRLRQELVGGGQTDPYNYFAVRYEVQAAGPGRGPDPRPSGRSAGPAAVLEAVPAPLPRAWLVERTITLPPLRQRGLRQLADRTREVFCEAGRVRDLRQTAVLEADSVALLLSPQRAAAASQPVCRVERAEPDMLEITAHCRGRSLLVVSDFYLPGWMAEVTSGDGRSWHAPIYRTNRTMRGIFLPAGQLRVVLRYRPPAFLAGAAMSAVSWWLLAIVGLRRLRRAGAE